MAQYFTVHPTHPQPRLVRLASDIVRDGGVIAYPTDSSYALGCQLGNAEAAKRMRAIRGVDDKHFLTLVCRDLADAGHFVRLSNWQFRIVRQGVPGPFTFLLPATREVPRRLLNRRRNTVGLRVPSHPVVAALLAELREPILSTTLILPGETRPLNDANTIRERLQAAIDLVIDAGPCPAIPTTVIDLSAEAAAVVRLGAGDPGRLGLTFGKIQP
jgi:tRNA threonylcarbamoyl adenosine modification protein (Sua5/YciO/YrdC/YwlC family)